jgi:hypothetical protein
LVSLADVGDLVDRTGLRTLNSAPITSPFKFKYSIFLLSSLTTYYYNNELCSG